MMDTTDYHFSKQSIEFEMVRHIVLIFLNSLLFCNFSAIATFREVGDIEFYVLSTSVNSVNKS